MVNKPEVDGASIVMLGSFNPAIFQPYWLSSQGLIRPEEATKANITVIQTEMADFSCDWFQLQVLQGRFMLLSSDPRQYAPLRDLAAAILAVLPHTPVTAIGLNRHFHFQMPSVDSWHAIGHLLAPKEPWHSIMDKPGLRSLLMEGYRANGGGVLHIKVEPSTKVEHGVFIEFNEDFRQKGETPPDGTHWIASRLNENWDSMMKFAEASAEHLLGLVKQ